LREGRSCKYQPGEAIAPHCATWAAWVRAGGYRESRMTNFPCRRPAVLQFVVDHVARTTDDGLRADLPATLDVGSG